MNCRTKRGKRSGFSLVELVVVVLIMGIMAAVAAPKLFNKIEDANNSSARQSLAVVRAALDQYNLENGEWPSGDGAFDADSAFVTGFLKGGFPALPDGNNLVTISTGTDALAHDSGDTNSWLFNSTTGELRINDSAKVVW